MLIACVRPSDRADLPVEKCAATLRNKARRTREEELPTPDDSAFLCVLKTAHSCNESLVSITVVFAEAEVTGISHVHDCVRPLTWPKRLQQQFLRCDIISREATSSRAALHGVTRTETGMKET